MSDHTITACCLNMEALLREAVGLLPAEPDWKGRVIAELNRPPATPVAQPPAPFNESSGSLNTPGAVEGPYKPGFDLAFGKCVYRPGNAPSAYTPSPHEWLRQPEIDALAARVKVLDDLLVRARVFVEADVRMMEDISRHAPLPHDEQAKHNAMVDAGECLSQTLLDDIDAALNPPAQAGGGRANG